MSRIEFSVATPEEFRFDSAARTSFVRPSSLSPLEAYLGLKSLFGEPNREHIDETAQQWIFFIKTNGARIEVNDWKLESWSIHVYEKDQDEARASRLIVELEKQIANASAKRRAIIPDLLKKPAGHVIENPFALHYQTAEELIAIAEKLRSERGDAPGSAPMVDSQYTLCRAAFFQLVAAIEGLLNLVYEIYLKVELRDDRVADRLIREQIDVKLRLAPVYCDCFAGQPIDHTTQAFRNFHRLVNARNDFIHANVTRAMKTSVVNYDGITFLVNPERNRDATVPDSMSDFGIEETKSIKGTVDSILLQVLTSMKPRYKKEFGSVVHEQFINVEYEDGVPVIVV
jgi:hypothetical protein